MLPLYLSHVCSFPLPGGNVLLHTDKNVQRNICVNFETMLRNVLNMASVPHGKEIVD